MKKLSQNNYLRKKLLIGLFLSIILRFCKSNQTNLIKLHYLILRNIDFIANNVKRVILKHFFNHYLFEDKYNQNKREKRFKAIKFICYIEKELSFYSFSKIMRLNKMVKSL